MVIFNIGTTLGEFIEKVVLNDGWGVVEIRAQLTACTEISFRTEYGSGALLTELPTSVLAMQIVKWRSVPCNASGFACDKKIIWTYWEIFVENR